MTRGPLTGSSPRIKRTAGKGWRYSATQTQAPGILYNLHWTRERTLRTYQNEYQLPVNQQRRERFNKWHHHQQREVAKKGSGSCRRGSEKRLTERLQVVWQKHLPLEPRLMGNLFARHGMRVPDARMQCEAQRRKSMCNGESFLAELQGLACRVTNTCQYGP